MRIAEKTYPYVLGVIVGAVILYLKVEIKDITNFKDILSATITFSSIIIAFLSTMVSIFVSLANSDVMQRIKNQDGEGLLTSYIVQTVVGGLILVVYSMVLLMCLKYEGDYSKYLMSLYLFLLTFLIFSSYRILSLTSNILKSALKESKKLNPSSKKEIVTPRIKNPSE